MLFDQVFNHTVTTPSQSEVDLLIPLGDHQHSTRLVLAHDANDATYVAQSIDYAQFGRITALRDAAGTLEQTPSGAPSLLALDSAFTHHGSITDPGTGLQLKGERWYSSDLGRFISEDPVQDGSNWYMFAGNDPVNFADPSGLSQQGYPLAGGYSGNVTREPTIKLGNLVGSALSSVGYAIGQGVAGISNALASSRSAPFTSPIQLGNAPTLYSQQFLNQLGPVVASNQATAAKNHFSQVGAALNAGLRPSVTATSTSTGWLGAIGGALQTAVSFIYETASNYPGYLGSELASAGRTIIETGRSTGDFIGDHLSLAYYDPQAEATRAARSVVQTAMEIKNTAAYVYNHPYDAAMGAGAAAIDYADRLTNDPNVSGELLGNGAVAWATGGARQVLGRTAAAGNTVRTNAELVQDVATRAGQWAQRSRQQITLANASPQTIGTKQHKYAKGLLDRYQRIYGDRNLVTENPS